MYGSGEYLRVRSFVIWKLKVIEAKTYEKNIFKLFLRHIQGLSGKIRPLLI